MAISKEQPMRSAEVELVDKVNELDGTLTSEIEERTEADADLQNQLGDGFHDFSVTEVMTAAYEVISPTEWNETFDSTLPAVMSEEIATRSDADSAINAKIGTGFDAEDTVADAIDDLQTQIGTGFDAENTISTAISDLENEIGSGFDAEHTVTGHITAIENLIDVNDWVDEFETGTIFDVATYLFSTLSDIGERHFVGKTDSITIAANATVTGTETFVASLEYEWFVYAMPIMTTGLLEDITLSITSVSNSGFAYSITNNGNSNATLKIGYSAFGA